MPTVRVVLKDGGKKFIILVFRTLYRGFCLLRTEYGFCGLPAPRSGLRDGCNGHGFAPSGSEPC